MASVGIFVWASRRNGSRHWVVTQREGPGGVGPPEYGLSVVYSSGLDASQLTLCWHRLWSDPLQAMGRRGRF